MKDKIWEKIGQPVIVNALGVKYTGTFKGADEEWLFLQCETTWVQIPWAEVTSFRAEGQEEMMDQRETDRDPAYFNSDPEKDGK